MRSLCLIRHAKSSWDNPALSDFDRPLDGRGQREAPLMAQRFAAGAGLPLQMISSPALRARTTAAIFAEALQLPLDSVRFDASIYEASPATLLRLVCALDDACPNAALFGHNPGFTDLCHQLARCEFDEMPPCAVVRIDLDIDRWADAETGTGRVVAYTYPKERQ